MKIISNQDNSYGFSPNKLGERGQGFQDLRVQVFGFNSCYLAEERPEKPTPKPSEGTGLTGPAIFFFFSS